MFVNHLIKKKKDNGEIYLVAHFTILKGCNLGFFKIKNSEMLD